MELAGVFLPPRLELTTTPVLAVSFGRFYSKSRSGCVAEAGLELIAVLLPLPPSSRNDSGTNHACSITIISTAGPWSPEPRATLTVLHALSSSLSCLACNGTRSRYSARSCSTYAQYQRKERAPRRGEAFGPQESSVRSSPSTKPSPRGSRRHHQPDPAPPTPLRSHRRTRRPAFLTGSTRPRGGGRGGLAVAARGSAFGAFRPPYARKRRGAASPRRPSAERLPPGATRATTAAGKAKGATEYTWAWSPHRSPALLLPIAALKRDTVPTSAASALRSEQRACARASRAAVDACA